MVFASRNIVYLHLQVIIRFVQAVVKTTYLQIKPLYPSAFHSKVLSKSASISTVTWDLVLRDLILSIILSLPLMHARLLLVHLRLRVISLHLQYRLLADAILGAHGRNEVDEEREDVEGEDEGDGPFEDGGRVGIVFLALYTEC